VVVSEGGASKKEGRKDGSWWKNGIYQKKLKGDGTTKGKKAACRKRWAGFTRKSEKGGCEKIGAQSKFM